MVISTKLPKEKVVSLIWSFCFNRVLGKVLTNFIITWVMAMATRVAGDKEGESGGGNSDGDGNEGERRQRGR